MKRSINFYIKRDLLIKDETVKRLPILTELILSCCGK